jgi:hypothetical protein
MKFYKIDSRGPLFLNRGTGTPANSPANEGRIYYEDGNEEVFYADAAAWIRMYSENNLTTLITNINSAGAFIRKDQNDTTTFKIQIDGGMQGDVLADNGAACLTIGATPGACLYTGQSVYS